MAWDVAEEMGYCPAPEAAIKKYEAFLIGRGIGDVEFEGVRIEK
jgi:hypothetical protein